MPQLISDVECLGGILLELNRKSGVVSEILLQMSGVFVECRGATIYFSVQLKKTERDEAASPELRFNYPQTCKNNQKHDSDQANNPLC